MAKLDVADIDDALQRADAQISASESHGSLCGMLCARNDTTPDQWLDLLLQDADAGNVLVGEARSLLRPVYDETRRGLSDPNCDFQLLFPDDEEPLKMRTDALVKWCQGFLFGLAAGGVKDLSGLPEDVVDFIQDMSEITRASPDLGEGGEEDEAAFVDLVEYIRMGILLSNEELNPSSAPLQPH